MSGMNAIKIRKSELLTKIEQNLETHRANFLEALEGYKKQFIIELETNLANARAGKSYDGIVNLPMPHDHTKDYERAIKMLQMSLDTELTISAHEFSQYVEDDWGWKHDFISTANMYNGNKL